RSPSTPPPEPISRSEQRPVQPPRRNSLQYGDLVRESWIGRTSIPGIHAAGSPAYGERRDAGCRDSKESGSRFPAVTGRLVGDVTEWPPIDIREPRRLGDTLSLRGRPSGEARAGTVSCYRRRSATPASAATRPRLGIPEALPRIRRMANGHFELKRPGRP